MTRTMRMASVALLLLGAVAVGCGGSDGSSSSPSDQDAIEVTAAFYPLQWVSEQVGGERVEVSSLTKAGAEPHDLELTPSEVAPLGEAGLVVYLSGFQPAVDEAVAQEAGSTAFDVADASDLSLTYTPIEEGREATEEAGETDPPFWLDPTRLAKVSSALAARLGEVDPDGAANFDANAEALNERLATLDGEFEDALADCGNKELVTSHNAFGYLAQRYGLEQIGITGLTPDAEPSPADLAEVTRFVKDNDVKTIYFETLASPAIAETVARDAGAKTEVLDPLEGLNEQSQGGDYLEVMRANLANLQKGQPCP